MRLPKNHSSLSFIISVMLVGLTLMAYWPVQHLDFVNYDDFRYVLENEQVKKGITGEGILWAFTNFEAGFWHPITWLSHMLDCRLYGLNPGGHHFTNLLFHLFNTLLLFSLLKRMTGEQWRSAFVAALFALHPLHVESVAWVSQRKDLVSTFFWFLTLFTYKVYVDRTSVSSYLLTILCFTLGLMAKSMLVTVPLMLLVLDYWPLDRLSPEKSGSGIFQGKRSNQGTSFWESHLKALIVEKIPFFLLSALFVLTTFKAEESIGALPNFSSITLGTRISNALLSYTLYIKKTILPLDLSVIYLHPDLFPLWKVLGATAFLGILSTLFLLCRRHYPYLLTGWLWYLITLLPVIGIVQIGSHAYADRYTYVSLIGLFLIIAWGVPDLLSTWKLGKRLIYVLSILLALVFIPLTWMQIQHWKNSETLFQKAISSTENNFVAHDNLGFVLALKGRLDEAVGHYEEALRINPHYGRARFNLANALQVQGKYPDAIYHYEKLIETNPGFNLPHFNIANTFARLGDTRKAILHYTHAIGIDPGDGKSHNNLGHLLMEQGRPEEALYHFKEAIQINPGDPVALHNLKLAEQKLKDRKINDKE